MQRKQDAVTIESRPERLLTLGDYAHKTIGEQYYKTVKYEKRVLADKDAENLHQMRVGTRRLRTALQVFDRAIALPKAASVKGVRSLAATLGHLRDLDVQIAALQTRYRPILPEPEQTRLDAVLHTLNQQRRKAFAATESALTRSRYQALKTGYEAWLEQPRYTAIAQLPLVPLVPDLLSPLLSELLLHPGWLVTGDRLDAESETLHDLRKSCKHVRYQAEFFARFYSPAFTQWVDEVKAIQAALGKVQDTQVLTTLLAHLSNSARLPGVHHITQEIQTEALADWESTRTQYLDPAYRQRLRHLLLSSAAA